MCNCLISPTFFIFLIELFVCFSFLTELREVVSHFLLRMMLPVGFVDVLYSVEEVHLYS